MTSIARDSARSEGARAWVHIDGTGTAAIRDSHGISSLTDNNTGDYTIAFTNSFANANYSANFGCNSGSTYFINYYSYSNTSSTALRILGYSTSVAVDLDIAACNIHGDLA